MKRSNWIPLLAAGCAAAGVAVYALLKKKKAACKSAESEADIVGECWEPCCPAEGCAPGADCGCAEAPAAQEPCTEEVPEFPGE